MNDLAVKNQGIYEGSSAAPGSRDKTNASNNATDAFKMLVSNMEPNTATSVAALGSKASFMSITDNNDEYSSSHSYDREPHDNDTDNYTSQDRNSYDDNVRPEHRSDENRPGNCRQNRRRIWRHSKSIVHRIEKQTTNQPKHI